MDNNLEIVTEVTENEGLEAVTTAAKSTSQIKPIAAGVGVGLLGGALICWGVSKLIAWNKAKKEAKIVNDTETCLTTEKPE